MPCKKFDVQVEFIVKEIIYFLFLKLVVRFRPEAALGVKGKKRWSYMHAAVLRKSLRSIKLLLDHHVSINLQDFNGRTPLMMTAVVYEDSIARFLLEHDALSTIQDHKGYSVAHWAVQEGNVKLLELLAEQESFNNLIHLNDEQGIHIIQLASILGHNIMLQKIIDHNADVNVQDKAGFTALHYAAARNDTETCNLLLEAGADIKILDKKKRAPYEYAKNSALKQILEKGY